MQWRGLFIYKLKFVIFVAKFENVDQSGRKLGKIISAPHVLYHLFAHQKYISKFIKCL